MKYGILGDIHSNLEALEVVLEKMEKEGVKAYLSVGDIVGYGANPTECIKKLRDLRAKAVAGNHDFASIGYINLDFFNIYAKLSAQWTREQLKKEDVEWIKKLRFVERDSKHGWMIVHSSLDSPELYEYMLTENDVETCFEKQRSKICFTGHSHIPVNFIKDDVIEVNTNKEIVLEKNKKYIINVGSIGQPRDENPLTTCVIYDSDKGVCQITRLNYNINKCSEKIIRAGLPSANAERIKIGK